MAKRKTKAIGHRAGKTRVELRLDDDVHEKIKDLADGAEVTVNQLVNAVVRWVGDKGHIGEGKYDQNGVLRNEHLPGVVWVGETGYVLSEDEIEEIAWKTDRDVNEISQKVTGKHFVTFDFTERRIIKEEL